MFICVSFLTVFSQVLGGPSHALKMQPKIKVAEVREQLVAVQKELGKHGYKTIDKHRGVLLACLGDVDGALNAIENLLKEAS